MYLSLSLSLSLYLSWSLSFCWSGHVFSSLWSNVSKVKSLKDRSLKVFSKCICHCLCLCLSSCPFVGQVRFSQHSDQMPQRSKVSKIALWRCSLNVFIIVFCLSSCPFVGQIKFSQHSISNASLGISLHLPSNIHSINHRAQQLGMNCELSSS